MTAIAPLRDSVAKARTACLSRLKEIEYLATELRASLYDPDGQHIAAIQIEMKGRAVAEAFEIHAAVTEALHRAQNAKSA